MAEPNKPVMQSVAVAPATVPAPSGTPAKAAYVLFTAEINPTTSESLLAVAANYVGQKIEEVHLLFATSGGDVAQGMALYHTLRGMPFKLITHNIGNVDSIGNVIFLAGRTRYACAHSTFMFHGVGFDGVAGVRLEEKILKERLTSLLSDQARIAAVIAERSRLSKETVEGFFREGQTKDATFAVGCGIVDEIRDVQIPAGSSVVSLVFQRKGV
jgi:ATP-dependent protease ClpP protease subunit